MLYGDQWDCPCGYSNFDLRKQCRNCGKPRGDAPTVPFFAHIAAWPTEEGEGAVSEQQTTTTQLAGTDKELLDALNALVDLANPAEAKRLLDLARLALLTDQATRCRVTLDDAQRCTLVAACIATTSLSPGDTTLTNLISILSGTDTTVVVHRAYPPRRFTEEQKP